MEGLSITSMNWFMAPEDCELTSDDFKPDAGNPACYVTRQRADRWVLVESKDKLEAPWTPLTIEIAQEPWYFDPVFSWTIFIVFQLFVWGYLLFFFTFNKGWSLTPCSKIKLKLDENHDGVEDIDRNKIHADMEIRLRKQQTNVSEQLKKISENISDNDADVEVNPEMIENEDRLRR